LNRQHSEVEMEVRMFRELTEELLDLKVVEKGFGDALFATVEPETGGGQCSCSCSYLCISLCCSI
jgi:hypothetical protein